MVPLIDNYTALIVFTAVAQGMLFLLCHHMHSVLGMLLVVVSVILAWVSVYCNVLFPTYESTWWAVASTGASRISAGLCIFTFFLALRSFAHGA